jgi:hypothetical protein
MIMQTMRKGLALGFLVLASARCASVTNLHTAKVLEKGAHSHTIAGGVGNVDLDGGDGELASKTIAVDYMFRYGLTEKDEVGVKLTNLGAYAMADYKRALIEGEKFYLSAGAALGGTQVTMSVGEEEASTTFIDIYVPVYADYWVTPTMALYASPKYILRTVSGESSDVSHQVGVSGGFRWGQSSGFLAEIGYNKQLGEGDLSYWQAMGGFFF